MRISKLFHWLYASIMLMPIFAIGVKSLYVTFNPNAKDSYYGEFINQSETISIKGNELQVNNTYRFNLLPLNDINSLDITSTSNFYYCRLIDSNLSQLESYYNTDVNFRFYRNPNDVGVNLNYSFYISQNNTNIYVAYTQPISTVWIEFELINYYNNANLQFQFFTYIEYNDYSYIDNVFYYSVEQISNESLFNWANGTFLAQPLLFITNLFGVPSISPIITILCYWFAISVIWLVFDVIMYIPLLVHRWLDKGVIE